MKYAVSQGTTLLFCKRRHNQILTIIPNREKGARDARFFKRQSGRRTNEVTLRRVFVLDKLSPTLAKILLKVSARIMEYARVAQIVHLLSAVQSTSLLHPYEDTFKSLQVINLYKSKESISPEELARLLKIGLKTAQRTLQATTLKFIRTTGALS